MASLHILVLHGPNLNLLGKREPAIYGKVTLDQINADLGREAETLEVDVSVLQSNSEGTLVDAVQGALGLYQGLLINAGAYTNRCQWLTNWTQRRYLSSVAYAEVAIPPLC